jgi:hypothetical protein
MHEERIKEFPLNHTIRTYREDVESVEEPMLKPGFSRRRNE